MAERFDTARSRDLGELIGEGIRVWRAYFLVFFALALLMVAPIRLLVDGLWAGTLDEFFPSNADLAPTLVSTFCDTLIIPVLVTTMHVHAVQDLADGRAPSLTRSTKVPRWCMSPVRPPRSR